MKGTNLLQLNEATMIEALQEYLAKRMPTNTPVVQSIKSISVRGSDLFEITVNEAESTL